MTFMKSIKNNLIMYGFGLCILGLLLLVSATNNTPHDTGNSQILNCSDGTVVNLTFTPHIQLIMIVWVCRSEPHIK